MNSFTAGWRLLQHPENQGHPFKTLLRMFWWKINQLFFHLPVLYSLTPTKKIICEPNNSYGSFIVYARFPEYSELKFTSSYLEKSDTFIDVGAHIGDGVLLAADKITNGRIIAFEPTPAIITKLKMNLTINGLEKKVQVVEKIVSDKVGSEMFILQAESEINSIAHKHVAQKAEKTVKILATTLDAFAAQENLTQIQLLKIDVEGAEPKVFDGAKKLLQKHALEVIIFEINPRGLTAWGSSPQELCLFVEKFGYQLYEFRHDGKLMPINVEAWKTAKTCNLVAALSKISVQRRLQPFMA